MAADKAHSPAELELLARVQTLVRAHATTLIVQGTLLGAGSVLVFLALARLAGEPEGSAAALGSALALGFCTALATFGAKRKSPRQLVDSLARELSLEALSAVHDGLRAGRRGPLQALLAERVQRCLPPWRARAFAEAGLWWFLLAPLVGALFLVEADGRIQAGAGGVPDPGRAFGQGLRSARQAATELHGKSALDGELLALAGEVSQLAAQAESLATASAADLFQWLERAEEAARALQRRNQPATALDQAIASLEAGALARAEMEGRDREPAAGPDPGSDTGQGGVPSPAGGTMGDLNPAAPTPEIPSAPSPAVAATFGLVGVAPRDQELLRAFEQRLAALPEERRP